MARKPLKPLLLVDSRASQVVGICCLAVVCWIVFSGLGVGIWLVLR